MSYNIVMTKLLLLSITVLLFLGCANKRGISMKYYNDCREYYDLQGSYHKVCDENIIEYEDLKKPFQFTEEATKQPHSNVW